MAVWTPALGCAPSTDARAFLHSSAAATAAVGEGKGLNGALLVNK